MSCEQCGDAPRECPRDASCGKVIKMARFIHEAAEAGRHITRQDVFSAGEINLPQWNRWMRKALGEVLDGEIGYETVRVPGEDTRGVRFITVV